MGGDRELLQMTSKGYGDESHRSTRVLVIDYKSARAGMGKLDTTLWKGRPRQPRVGAIAPGIAAEPSTTSLVLSQRAPITVIEASFTMASRG